MEDIYYLVHTTKKYNEDWKELQTSNIDNFEDQFPGVYLTLVTKDNIRKVSLFPGNTKILIFSNRLLEQQNYHINIRDYNGYISENNTYFPWNLNTAVHKINESENGEYIGHEVVFHDPIPMDYLCIVIDNVSSAVSPNALLPNVPIKNKTAPDMTKEPFYCYPLEKNYTGIDPFPESSREFFVKMAKTCNVDITLPTDEIINKIKKKIPYLYANRNKQQIKILKQNGSRTRTRTRKRSKPVSFEPFF
jgi:hypothetical protein